MKKNGLLSLTLAALLFCVSATAAEGESQDIVVESEVKAFDENDIVRISEAFGHMIGKNLKNPGFSFNLESIIKGIRDGAAGKESPMTEEEYDQTITLIQENVFNELAQANLQKAEKFLEENAHNKDVIAVEEGKIQYIVLESGEGAEISQENAPLIHYTGKYLDGTTFGSSRDHDEPITLPLTQTIPGFSKGLLGAKEGEKRRLFIHPDMGYGTSGHMPPNSLLIFDVEIVKVESEENDALNAMSFDEADEFDEIDEVE